MVFSSVLQAGCTLDEVCVGNSISVNGKCQDCEIGSHASERHDACIEDTAEACGFPAINCVVPNSTRADCIKGACEITCNKAANYELLEGACVKSTNEACGIPPTNCLDFGKEHHGTAECVMGACKMTSCDPAYYEDCKVEACEGNAYLNNSACESCKDGFHVNDTKDNCVQDTLEACGYPVKNCLVANSIASGCASGVCEITCASDYYLENGACVPNTLESCGISKDNCKEKYPNGTSACTNGVCNLVKCDPDYHISNDACVHDTDEACGSRMQNCTTDLMNATNAVCESGSCAFSCSNESLTKIPNEGCFQCKQEDTTHSLQTNEGETDDILLSNLLNDQNSLCTNNSISISSRVPKESNRKIVIRDKSIKYILNALDIDSYIYYYNPGYTFPEIVELDSLIYAGILRFKGTNSGSDKDEVADITKVTFNELQEVSVLDINSLQFDELNLPKLKTIKYSISLFNVVSEKDITIPNLETIGVNPDECDYSIANCNEPFVLDNLYTPLYLKLLDDYFKNPDESEPLPVGPVMNFQNLHTIYGTLKIISSNFKYRFPSLKTIVDGDLDIEEVEDCSFPQLEHVPYLTLAYYGGINQFEALKSVSMGVSISFDYTCEYNVLLPKLESVGDLYLEFRSNCGNKPLKEFSIDSLRTITDGNLWITANGTDNIQTISFASLQSIHGNLIYSPFDSLKNLSLPKLEKVEGEVIFNRSTSTDNSLEEISLPELTEIQKGLSIKKLKKLTSVSIPKLKKITGGSITIENCPNLTIEHCNLGENECVIKH